MNKTKENLANKLADAIVKLVEHASEPVTLAQIEREIPGFKAENNATPSWEWVTGEDQDENLIWDGMTEEGCAALRSVIVERKVAIQLAHPLSYRLEGGCPVSKSWVPIFLLPTRMANLETPRLLMRGSQENLDQVMARAAAKGAVGFRVLSPVA